MILCARIFRQYDFGDQQPDFGRKMDVLIDFCECLIQSAKRKFYLIFDYLSARQYKKLTAWIMVHCDHVGFLSPY